MINEKQQVIETYIEQVNFDDKDLEIKGELFETPIIKTGNAECYARIKIYDKLTDFMWGVTHGDGKGEIYFPEITKEKLKELVLSIKTNIYKYKL